MIATRSGRCSLARSAIHLGRYGVIQLSGCTSLIRTTPYPSKPGASRGRAGETRSTTVPSDSTSRAWRRPPRKGLAPRRTTHHRAACRLAFGEALAQRGCLRGGFYVAVSGPTWAGRIWHHEKGRGDRSPRTCSPCRARSGRSVGSWGRPLSSSGGSGWACPPCERCRRNRNPRVGHETVGARSTARRGPPDTVADPL